MASSQPYIWYTASLFSNNIFNFKQPARICYSQCYLLAFIYPF